MAERITDPEAETETLLLWFLAAMGRQLADSEQLAKSGYNPHLQIAFQTVIHRIRIAPTHSRTRDLANARLISATGIQSMREFLIETVCQVALHTTGKQN